MRAKYWIAGSRAEAGSKLEATYKLIKVVLERFGYANGGTPLERLPGSYTDKKRYDQIMELVVRADVVIGVLSQAQPSVMAAAEIAVAQMTGRHVLLVWDITDMPTSTFTWSSTSRFGFSNLDSLEKQLASYLASVVGQ